MCVLRVYPVCVSVGGNDDGWRAKEGLRQLVQLRAGRVNTPPLSDALRVAHPSGGTTTESAARLTFIHSADKDPFVGGSWEFGVCVCVDAYESTSVFFLVPLIACGQTAVLPWFYQQMLGLYNETVPLRSAPPLRPCWEAVHIRLLC